MEFVKVSIGPFIKWIVFEGRWYRLRFHLHAKAKSSPHLLGFCRGRRSGLPLGTAYPLGWLETLWLSGKKATFVCLFDSQKSRLVVRWQPAAPKEVRLQPVGIATSILGKLYLEGTLGRQLRPVVLAHDDSKSSHTKSINRENPPDLNSSCLARLRGSVAQGK